MLKAREIVISTSTGDVVYKKESMLKETVRRFSSNRLAMVGLGLFLIILFMALFADIIVPYRIALEQTMSNRLQTPSAANWLGTDNFGRDIFARIIHGSRNSLLMGIGSVLFGMTVGGILGSLAGFYGGKVDSMIMRISDTVMCIPLMLLTLCIVAALGTSMFNVMIALMVSQAPKFTRLVRSSILSVVDQDFIEAARSCGTPALLIITKHVLPNAIGPIIVQSTMAVASMIIWAAGISFVGMGIQPPNPEWGAMLSEAKIYMQTAPYMVVFPGLMIGITAFSLNVVGDGLRDALDPRLKD